MNKTLIDDDARYRIIIARNIHSYVYQSDYFTSNYLEEYTQLYELHTNQLIFLRVGKSASCTNIQQFCGLIFTLAFVPVVNFQHNFNFVEVGGLRGGMMVDQQADQCSWRLIFWAETYILGCAHGYFYFGRCLFGIFWLAPLIL